MTVEGQIPARSTLGPVAPVEELAGVLADELGDVDELLPHALIATATAIARGSGAVNRIRLCMLAFL
jgi:hypothetical protein